MNPEQKATAKNLSALLTAIERAHAEFPVGDRLLRLSPGRPLVVHELASMRATVEVMLKRFLKGAEK